MTNKKPAKEKKLYSQLGVGTRDNIVTAELEKVVDLLDLFKNNEDRNLRFWIDKNGFGDIVGIVPVERFYERERGSKYFPFTDKISELCYKFVVIDICLDSKDFKLNIDDLKKKKILQDNGMIYFKHNDINLIYQEVLSIK